MQLKRLFVPLVLTTLLALGLSGIGLRLPSVRAQAPSQTQEASGLEAGALLEYEANTIEVFERYSPSVVAVNVELGGETLFPEGLEEFFEGIPEQFRRFFQQPQQPQPQQGSGSGFVIDDEGRIITNYHVVAAALGEGVELQEDARITVTFPSSDEAFPVRVVGANALYELALLEVENPDAVPQEVREVVPIPIADSDEVRVGQKAIAIGNPFGFATTVTQGIVSGVSRSLPGLGQGIDVPLIQTDAPINPGNSGGPLLNSRGELIGVNTAIIPGIGFNGERGNIGIGFAVPANILRDNLAQLTEGGLVDLRSRARLGVSILDVRAYPESVRESLELPEEGVAILQVEPGSAAERAGLQGGDFEVMIGGQSVPAGGDVILAVDGSEVTSTSELQNLILSRNEGDTVTLTIWRDGEERTVDATLAVVSQEQRTEGEGGEETGVRLGVSLRDVGAYPESVRNSLDLPESGVVVLEVEPGSPADEAGLRGGQFIISANGEEIPAGGDVILSVDGTGVTSAQELQELISSKNAGDSVELRIWRDGEERNVNATLAAPQEDQEGGGN